MQWNQVKNVRENQRTNQEFTTQRNCQHWLHKAYDDDQQHKSDNTENYKDKQYGPHQKPG